MADISAKLVKELRDLTGAGFMECKKALVETNGDVDLVRVVANENDAVQGGGIFATSGTLTLTDSHATDNTADNGAGVSTGFGVDIVTTETDVTLDDRDGRGGTVEEFRRVRVVSAVGPSRLVEDGHAPSVECRERWNAARPDELAPRPLRSMRRRAG